MIIYTKESIFDSPARSLVNPVNTVGVMGKGLALEFKNRYPAMFEEYKALCATGTFVEGNLHYFTIEEKKIIINFPTKKHWRDASDIEYIRLGLVSFRRYYYEFPSVSFPQLGCGCGGLDWETEVKPVMEEYLADLPIEVYIHIYED